MNFVIFNCSLKFSKEQKKVKTKFITKSFLKWCDALYSRPKLFYVFLHVLGFMWFVLFDLFVGFILKLSMLTLRSYKTNTVREFCVFLGFKNIWRYCFHRNKQRWSTNIHCNDTEFDSKSQWFKHTMYKSALSITTSKSEILLRCNRWMSICVFKMIDMTCNYIRYELISNVY